MGKIIKVKIMSNTPQLESLNGLINGNGNLELFGLGTKGNLFRTFYTSSWQPWHVWNQGFNCEPPLGLHSLISLKNSRNNCIEVFALDETGVLYHSYYDTRWHPWTKGFNNQESKGDKFQKVVAINNEIHQNVELFGIGQDGRIYHCYFDVRWFPWNGDFGGGQNYHNLWAISNNNNRHTEVFAIDEEGFMCHRFFDGSWYGWAGLSKYDEDYLVDAFAINNAHNGYLELFAINAKGKLQHCYFDGKLWHPWSIGFNNQPTEVYLNKVMAIDNQHNKNTEVFALDLEGCLYHCFFDGKMWQPWQKDFHQAPRFNYMYVASNANKNLELFGVTNHWVLWHSTFSNKDLWSSWQKF